MSWPDAVVTCCMIIAGAVVAVALIHGNRPSCDCKEKKCTPT